VGCVFSFSFLKPVRREYKTLLLLQGSLMTYVRDPERAIEKLISGLIQERKEEYPQLRSFPGRKLDTL